MKNHTRITNTGTLAKTTGLLLLLSGCFLQGQAMACPGDKSDSKSNQGNNTESAADYYQSSDNPMRAD